MGHRAGPDILEKIEISFLCQESNPVLLSPSLVTIPTSGLETETVQHLVCCCEALSRQRYNVSGELTTEPNVICTATVTNLRLFISHTGLSKLC